VHDEAQLDKRNFVTVGIDLTCDLLHEGRLE
jgi:hypothetical protein